MRHQKRYEAALWMAKSEASRIPFASTKSRREFVHRRTQLHAKKLIQKYRDRIQVLHDDERARLRVSPAYPYRNIRKLNPEAKSKATKEHWARWNENHGYGPRPSGL